MKLSAKKPSAKEREEKRLALEKEREEKRLALEREKEEKRLKLEKEKNEREERKRQLAAEKQEKREKLEQERESKRIKLENEKQEKNAQKEEQRLKKLKEIELRNQEKEKKLEEQRKLEEKLHKKQEKQQQILLNFIKKGANTSSSSLNESFKSDENDDEVMLVSRQTEKFKVFQLQPNQTLAIFLPEEIRKRFNRNRASLDSALVKQDNELSILYLTQLKQKDYKPFRRNKYKERCDEKQNEADIIIMDDSAKKDNKMRSKLFQFHENHRPAFFGTWRKRSKVINGRRPFNKDNDYFQYDVDSDDEWEDDAEIQGESLKDSDSEASENENGYELDDFMVPHGHLSDDEQQMPDEEDPKEECDSRQYQPLLKERDILEEREKKMKRLKPVVIGPYWKNSADEVINDPLLKMLEQYTVMYL